MPGMIRICGLGVYPPHETTLETLQILGDCRVVYCDLADRKAFAWLSGYCRSLKRPSGAAEVLRAAAGQGEVGLAVWGHPQFSSRLARQVQLACRRSRVAYRVTGSISPIGSAFARSVSFLGGDYGYQGIQAYELKTLLDDPKVLTNRLPLVVYAETAPRERWRSFFKLLRGGYPAEHEVKFYASDCCAQRALTVGQMDRLEPGGGVILVPPAPTSS